MTTNSSVTRRTALVIAGAAALSIGLLALRAFVRPFPPDTTPDGAYLRIALALSEHRESDIFAYLETDAQWASFSVRDMRREAAGLVRSSYPDGERQRLLPTLEEEAAAKDGPELFALMAKRKGFAARLKKDLSGVQAVEIQGDRASVVTARGTRYPFRRRENGIWGLTIFTAELVAERNRAARDLEVIRTAAEDYARAAKREDRR